MLLLLLKSSACLAIFMLFYKLLLEQTSAHTFKRFYLIGILIISIVIPFITFTEYVEVVTPEPQNFTVSPLHNYSIPQNVEIIETRTLEDYLPNILWTIYVFGVILYAFRFFKNLHQLFTRIKANEKIKNKNFIIVLLQNLVTPHTFFNYIFLNKTYYKQNKIPNEIILHEQTHAKQKHALDILCIELLQILFWFNPLLYFIKKDVKLNHEFLADQSVINKGANTKHYQQLLLAFSSNAPQNQLANAINYSLIKKRLTVMKIKTSKLSICLRSFIFLPILAILIYGFSQKVSIEKNNNLDTNHLTEIPLLKEGNGVTEATLKEYNDFTNEFNKTRRIGYDEHLRFTAIYKMMTKAQRKVVNKPHFQWFNLNKINAIPRHPTQKEFNRWKSSKNLTFSIDGETIKTKELNNYTPQDIYSYSNKFYNSEKGSYESGHYILKTKKGFQQQNQDYRIKTYNKMFLKYSNEITYYLNSDTQNDSELKILKTQLDDLYKVLTLEDIIKFKLLRAPKIPNKLQQEKTQKKATLKQIIEYNKLAKHCISQLESEFPIIKLKDVKRIKYLYGIMSKDQKKNAESYPDFSKIPPPIPPPVTPETKKETKEKPSDILAPATNKETAHTKKLKESLYLYFAEKIKQYDEQLKSAKTEKEKVEIIKQKKFLSERLDLISKNLEKKIESINKLLKVAKNDIMRATLKEQLNSLNNSVLLLKNLDDSIKSVENK
ncbi:M56 family metallopeptidase [Hyunsoonleella sp. 2307UL5-6]|uniref:M56 family metallopeptidase n=1 Tax=Hyunsoonleella sp. 2307UL5-6 TaxID=3384768 RepID=UPI0039BD52A2